MNEQTVGAHYGRADLAAVIAAGLRASGKNPERLTPEDLAPMDQFHTRGREATLELARLAGLSRGARVLDAGGGLGGAARTLAKEFGCTVTVLDLTVEYCEVGAALTAATGLSNRVHFEAGSALEMPFAAETYDHVFTQHSSMNIADKERLCAEVHRVLRPGGRLALHEVMAGSQPAVLYPVPWARAPEISHLRPPEAIRSLIASAGFKELAWVDQTAVSLDWFRARAAAAQGRALPPLGLHLLLGTDFQAMTMNFMRNLAENRVTIIQAVFERT